MILTEKHPPTLILPRKGEEIRTFPNRPPPGGEEIRTFLLYGGRLDSALSRAEGMGVFFREDHLTFSAGLPSSRNIAAPKKLTMAKTEKGI